MTRTRQLTVAMAFAVVGCVDAHAADNCGITEYLDRIEASCQGSPAAPQESPETSMVPVAAPKAEEFPKEPATDIGRTAAVPAHGELTESAPHNPPPQVADSHQQRRMAAGIMENARAARLQKIMSNRQ
ncbi:hypothetical protein FO488_13245 [Geobacter sp. FeAm09]|uniref:hypothetical protein n=1 Tax=Geobacter sp. FeAm09 TaxID=2597769 RepID=UPI0011ECC51A|nr:hypothetical protein [Geobacter sp. FeAm09]QEM69026.1 hypothetical protein FO488_13245 [Geobacter sp. FeAm09]